MNTAIRTCLAMLAATTLSVQATPSSLSTVGSLDAATRPAGVPLNYVVTPNGLFHPSCVIELASSDTLTARGDIRHADGSVSALAACAYPRYGSAGQVLPSSAADDPVAAFDGWIARSGSNAAVTPPASKMVSTFAVPSGPTTNVSQVLYYFPGLEDGQNVITILQPVLAWNGFGDHKWTMTNWNCCNNGHTFHGSTIPVSTGDKIAGSMVGQSCAGNVCPTWKLVSKDKKTGGSTTFNTDAYGQAFTWYFGGVLEAYGVSQCTHFPSNGSIKFTKDKVLDMNGNDSTPTNWIPWTGAGVPACNFSVAATQRTTTISWNTH